MLVLLISSYTMYIIVMCKPMLLNYTHILYIEHKCWKFVMVCKCLNSSLCDGFICKCDMHTRALCSVCKLHS